MDRHGDIRSRPRRFATLPASALQRLARPSTGSMRPRSRAPHARPLRRGVGGLPGWLRLFEQLSQPLRVVTHTGPGPPEGSALALQRTVSGSTRHGASGRGTSPSTWCSAWTLTVPPEATQPGAAPNAGSSMPAHQCRLINAGSSMPAHQCRLINGSSIPGSSMARLLMPPEPRPSPARPKTSLWRFRATAHGTD
jgi:hypothetical protein